MTEMPRVEHVVDYLRSHGWTITGRWRAASVWSRDEFDVLVPPDDAPSDAAARFRELTECVADAEGRPRRDVWRDLTTPPADVVSYRLPDEAAAITLASGARAIHTVRDLIASCARDVVNDRPREPGEAAGDVVHALLDRSLLSLHERTFGLDVSLPLDDGDPEPLGRSTVLLLLRYSTAVSEAAGSSDTDAFDRMFRQGISRSVCLALADLAGPGRRAMFELGFRWSPHAPLADRTVAFSHDVGERIRAGSKGSDPVADGGHGAVTGTVTGLTNDGSGSMRITVRGALHIDGVAVGGQRLVTVWLDSDQAYAAALTAHRDVRVVRAEGTMTRTRRTYGITTSATGFTMPDHMEM